MTLAEVRDNLTEIRAYYAHKELFELGFKETGDNTIVKIARAFNDIMKYAPARMYELYVYLYINNHLQVEYADEFGYAPEYVRNLNKNLAEYIQTKINERGQL